MHFAADTVLRDSLLHLHDTIYINGSLSRRVTQISANLKPIATGKTAGFATNMFYYIRVLALYSAKTHLNFVNYITLTEFYKKIAKAELTLLARTLQQ